MFDLFLVRVFLLVFCVGISAYTDYKTGYIYDKFSLSLIGVGLLFNFLSFSLMVNLKIIGIGVIIYLIGYLFYYYGKLGGGDIKLFIGIHMMLPYLNSQLFILWLIIVSCLLSVVVVSIIYFFKLLFILNKKILFLRKRKIFQAILMFLVFSFFIYYNITYMNLNSFFYFSLFPIFIGLFIFIFDEEVKKYIYLKHKKVSALEEGDVLAKEFISKAMLKTLKLEKKQILEIEDIKRIKKSNYKTLPIFDNLPRFGPYIFFGLLISFFYLYFFL